MGLCWICKASFDWNKASKNIPPAAMGSKLPLDPYGSIAAWQSSPSNIKYLGLFMIRFPPPMIAHG